MKIIRCCLVILSFFSASIQAGILPTTSFSVERLRVSSNTGNVYLYPSKPVEVKNSNCTSIDAYALDKDDENFNAMLSLILTASASQSHLYVFISTDHNDCIDTWQRVRVVDVDF